MPFFGDATDGAVLMMMITMWMFERLEQRLRPPPSRVADYGPLSGKQRALQRENGMPCIAIYCDRLSLSRRRLPFKSPFRSNHYLVRFFVNDERSAYSTAHWIRTSPGMRTAPPASPLCPIGFLLHYESNFSLLDGRCS